MQMRTVNIRMDERLIGALDAAAEAVGEERSDLARLLLEDALIRLADGGEAVRAQRVSLGAESARLRVARALERSDGAAAAPKEGGQNG